ncbi:MAG: 4-hydroxy-tetrahydrodipicolinate synthase [Rhodoferax sp.]|nr:4-hydroxy-tetrahydrodipicolinate synthase [Rhodoferax sp.]
MTSSVGALERNTLVASTVDFSGLWIPLVTPFRDDAVDHPALATLVKHLAPKGVAGFVVCGSTSEAAALSEAEQLDVLETVRRNASELPLIMGVSGYHLPKTVAWVEALAHESLAGVLVSAPCYIRPSQAGLVHWFEAIAQASAVPLVVYDIPYRTGAVLLRETLLRLAAHPNIAAVKDCGGDPAKTAAVLADTRLQVLSGEDLQIFSAVAQGGAGAIAASAHVHTERFAAVIKLLTRGDLASARALWSGLPELVEALFAEPNPGPVKALLAHQGLMHKQLRRPMIEASAELLDRLVRLHDEMGRPTADQSLAAVQQRA